MKKRAFLSMITLAGLCVIASSGVYAYMTGSEHSKNSISVGSVKTEIKEDFPGVEDSVYKKSIAILNTGQSDCYVRVFLGISDNKALPITGFGDTKDGPWYSANPDTTGIEDLMFDKTYAEHLSDVNSKWVYIPLEQESTSLKNNYSEEERELLGGWYYYMDPISSDEQTDNLINYVYTNFTDYEADRDFDIIVYQEAVQTRDKNGALFSGDDAWLQAWSEYINSVSENSSVE